MEFTNIIEFIEYQKQTIRELIILAEKQFEALKHNDLEELAAITQEQEAKINLLHSLREEGVKGLRDYMHHQEESSNLLNEIQKNRLNKLLTDIRIIYKDLQELTSLNRFLIKNAIKYSKNVLNLLEGSQSSVYGNQGNIKLNHARIMNTVI